MNGRCSWPKRAGQNLEFLGLKEAVNEKLQVQLEDLGLIEMFSIAHEELQVHHEERFLIKVSSTCNGFRRMCQLFAGEPLTG